MAHAKGLRTQTVYDAIRHAKRLGGNPPGAIRKLLLYPPELRGRSH